MIARLFIVVSSLLATSPALAQGALTLRGNYWRDRNTRVVQPAIELSKELPSGTVLGAHYLLDAITSASVAAGVIRDQPFTELRNEAGFSVGQRLGPALVSAAYSYSAESDYWAHTASLGVLLELFQKNTTIGGSLAYGNDRVALRMGPTNYNPVGGLQTIRAIVNLTQTLTPRLLAVLSYEIGCLGFGNTQNGWLANPYRTVNLGGAPSREQVPFQRIRQAATAGVHWLVPTGIRLMPYLAFRPAFRLYWDDWGVISESPELRLFVPVGPTELRVTGRFYNQNSVSFWSDDGVRPFYAPGTQGLPCTTCTLASSRFQPDGKPALFYTSDPKLGAFTSEFFELRLLVKLRGISTWRMPGAAWLGAGVVEISYGHYFNGGYAHTAFGDAEVAGLTLSWPL